MDCSCDDRSEQFTCSGVDCQVYVLSEENYIENPEMPKERYCLDCAMKKAGFTKEELWQLKMANPDSAPKCGDNSY